MDTRRLPRSERGPLDWQLHGSCRRCPVLEQCRRHALEVQEPYGIWGGLTEYERQRALRIDGRQLRAGESTGVTGGLPPG